MSLSTETLLLIFMAAAFALDPSASQLVGDVDFPDLEDNSDFDEVALIGLQGITNAPIITATPNSVVGSLNVSITIDTTTTSGITKESTEESTVVVTTTNSPTTARSSTSDSTTSDSTKSSSTAADSTTDKSSTLVSTTASSTTSQASSKTVPTTTDSTTKESSTTASTTSSPTTTQSSTAASTSISKSSPATTDSTTQEFTSESTTLSSEATSSTTDFSTTSKSTTSSTTDTSTTTDSPTSSSTSTDSTSGSPTTTVPSTSTDSSTSSSATTVSTTDSTSGSSTTTESSPSVPSTSTDSSTASSTTTVSTTNISTTDETTTDESTTSFSTTESTTSTDSSTSESTTTISTTTIILPTEQEVILTLLEENSVRLDLSNSLLDTISTINWNINNDLGSQTEFLNLIEDTGKLLQNKTQELLSWEAELLRGVVNSIQKIDFFANGSTEFVSDLLRFQIKNENRVKSLEKKLNDSQGRILGIAKGLDDKVKFLNQLLQGYIEPKVDELKDLFANVNKSQVDSLIELKNVPSIRNHTESSIIKLSSLNNQLAIFNQTQENSLYSVEVALRNWTPTNLDAINDLFQTLSISQKRTDLALAICGSSGYNTKGFPTHLINYSSKDYVDSSEKPIQEKKTCSTENSSGEDEILEESPETSWKVVAPA
ncbi:serine-rich adhesin for platelets [Drosophila eugracilis]|uniref:serine-rich adhesin for platelets n=1 Tax=Drosophila eugracilis TaxID=29029 RepID=UPI001BDA2AA3|nr:serine-rich adhesin for platelets [Drosophila eugracilis]